MPETPLTSVRSSTPPTSVFTADSAVRSRPPAAHAADGQQERRPGRRRPVVNRGLASPGRPVRHHRGAIVRAIADNGLAITGLYQVRDTGLVAMACHPIKFVCNMCPIFLLVSSCVCRLYCVRVLVYNNNLSTDGHWAGAEAIHLSSGLSAGRLPPECFYARKLSGGRRRVRCADPMRCGLFASPHRTAPRSGRSIRSWVPFPPLAR